MTDEMSDPDTTDGATDSSTGGISRRSALQRGAAVAVLPAAMGVASGNKGSKENIRTQTIEERTFYPGRSFGQPIWTVNFRDDVKFRIPYYNRVENPKFKKIDGYRITATLRWEPEENDQVNASFILAYRESKSDQWKRIAMEFLEGDTNRIDLSIRGSGTYKPPFEDEEPNQYALENSPAQYEFRVRATDARERPPTPTYRGPLVNPEIQAKFQAFKLVKA